MLNDSSAPLGVQNSKLRNLSWGTSSCRYNVLVSLGTKSQDELIHHSHNKTGLAGCSKERFFLVSPKSMGLESIQTTFSLTDGRQPPWAPRVGVGARSVLPTGCAWVQKEHRARSR